MTTRKERRAWLREDIEKTNIGYKAWILGSGHAFVGVLKISKEVARAFGIKLNDEGRGKFHGVAVATTAEASAEILHQLGDGATEITVEEIASDRRPSATS